MRGTKQSVCCLLFSRNQPEVYAFLPSDEEKECRNTAACDGGQHGCDGDDVNVSPKNIVVYDESDKFARETWLVRRTFYFRIVFLSPSRHAIRSALTSCADPYKRMAPDHLERPRLLEYDAQKSFMHLDG